MRKHFFPITNTVYANNGSGAEITGISQLNLLAEGAVALIDDDGTLIADGTAGTAPTLTSIVSLYVGGHHHTGGFDPKHASMVKQIYVAPVNKVIHIGSNGTDGDLGWSTPFTDLTSAGVMIQATPYEDGDNRFRRYEIALTSNLTESAAIDAIVAKINADSTCPATAAKVIETTNFGISLTSKTGRNFICSALGELGDTTIRTTTAHNPGFGTQALIQEIYDENKAIIGARDGADRNHVFTPYVVPAGNYHLYTLTYHEIRETEFTNETSPTKKYGLFAVPTTSTDIIADMDDILTAINAV